MSDNRKRAAALFALVLAALVLIAALRKAKDAPGELGDWLGKIIGKVALAVGLFAALRALLPRLLLRIGLGRAALLAVPGLSFAGAIGLLFATGAAGELLAGLRGAGSGESGAGSGGGGGGSVSCPPGTTAIRVSPDGQRWETHCVPVPAAGS